MATPVDPRSRMDEIGPSREIEVRSLTPPQPRRPDLTGVDAVRFSGERQQGGDSDAVPSLCTKLGPNQYSAMKWTHEHFTGA